jgi:hypothetical protein
MVDLYKSFKLILSKYHKLGLDILDTTEPIPMYSEEFTLETELKMLTYHS